MLFLAALEITVSTDELCCTCKLSLHMIIKILAFSQEFFFSLKRKSTKSPSQLHHCYLDNRSLFVDKNAVSSERVETKAKHAVIASMLVYFYVIDH
jgi:hypothetical protein